MQLSNDYVVYTLSCKRCVYNSRLSFFFSFKRKGKKKQVMICSRKSPETNLPRLSETGDGQSSACFLPEQELPPLPVNQLRFKIPMSASALCLNVV